MDNTTTTVIGIIVLIALIIGGYYLFAQNPGALTGGLQATTTGTLGLQGSSATTKEVVSIDIQNFAFSPATLTVKAGTKVTWTNRDSVAHTVTADSGLFDSGSLAQGQSFSYTFTAPGTVSYYCIPHPRMKASVTVTD